VAAGTRILAGLSILVCTPSPFDPARFRHLWMTVRFLSGLGCLRVKTIVLTDAVEPTDVQRLQQLVGPISDETEIRSERNFNDSRDLPWRHKKIIQEEFLSDTSPFDLFIYLEDDIFLTSENVAYFVAFRQALDRIGCIPSFVHRSGVPPTDPAAPHGAARPDDVRQFGLSILRDAGGIRWSICGRRGAFTADYLSGAGKNPKAVDTPTARDRCGEPRSLFPGLGGG
jgi:hypothetical protein